MKVTVDRGELMAATKRVAMAITGKATLPVLANVKLIVTEDALSLSTTDLDNHVTVRIDADAADQGSITAPCRVLAKLVRCLDAGPVTLAWGKDSAQLTVASGSASFGLPVLPADDFPPLDPVEPTTAFTIDAPELWRLLDRTNHAISTNATRFPLNGVLFERRDDDRLRAVACEDLQLAWAETILPAGAEQMRSVDALNRIIVIVPRRAAHMLRDVLAEALQWPASPPRSVDRVEVKIGPDAARFSFGGTALQCRLISGTFPDYERLIPRGPYPTRVIAPAASLRAALGRAMTLRHSKRDGLGVRLTFGPRQVAVTRAGNPDYASHEVVVEVEHEGAPVTVGVNAGLLRDILDLIGGRVSFEVMTSVDPLVIRDLDDGAVLYLLMPMSF